MKEDFSQALVEFTKNESANRMIVNSFKEIIPPTASWISFLAKVLIAIVISFYIFHSRNSIEIMYYTFTTIFTVQLTIFSVALTVFSIIFVFFDDKKIKDFAKHSATKKNITFLNRIANFYQSVLFLYAVNLILTGFLAFIVTILDSYFIWVKLQHVNLWIIFVLLVLYFLFVISVFYEIKSLIYNTVQIFRIGVLIRLNNYIKSEEI